MNAFVNLKPVLAPHMLESALPDWAEVLTRQQALQTHVWVDEWLAAVPQSTSAHADHSLAATGLEIAAHQQPVDTPVWQGEWLDWADNRTVAPTLAQRAAEAAMTHTVCPFVQAKTQPLADERNSAARRRKPLADIAA